MEQNRDVYVVPGRIGDALSEGCLKLIKEGAQVITSPMDIMATKSIELYYNSLQITDDKRNNLNTNSIFDDGFKNQGLQALKIWCIVKSICFQSVWRQLLIILE